jgi:hypothetical protein
MEEKSTVFSGLTPNQTKALPLFVAGETAVNISRRLKISQQQLSEWKKSPSFVNAVEMARREAFVNAQQALQAAANDSVETLRKLILDAESEQTRLRAAIFVIEQLKVAIPPEQPIMENEGTVNLKLLWEAIGVSRTETI